jgi:hypothetical protein
MNRKIMGIGIACLLAAHGATAVAQSAGEVTDLDLDTEADAVIESEVFTPRTTFRNRSGGEAVFYGQFNPAYQSFDDGARTTDGIVDNGNWNSRLGFRITQPLNDGALRFRFETGLGLRNSALISQDFKPEWIDWQRTSLRWFEAAWDSRFGSVSVGQGSSASDGTAGMDESFTFHAGATDSTDGFGSFRFRDGTGELTDITVGRVNDSFDGARRFRIRYDTPSYAGVTLSTSYGRNVLVSEDKRHYYDVAIRWSGDLGDFSVQTAAGYGWEDNPEGVNQKRAAGSLTVFHNPTGLNLAVSAGSRMNGPDYYYARAGWRSDFFEVGTTSLSVDYYRGRDFVTEGARTENYGLYAVQSFDAVSLDVYAGWRRFTYSDLQGGTYQDADGVLVGARWFF